MLLFLVGFSLTTQGAWLTIHNDFYQYDQNGNSIQTRSGCLQKFNGVYYWYGCIGKFGAPGFFNDQTCYSSTDLLHWTNEGIVLEASGTNRMDVLYNDSTEQYVMFLKTQVGDNCDLGIATCSTPNGKFEFKENKKVFGYQVGDPSVYKDDDGKAYYLFVWDSIPNANSGGISEHAIALLSPDYLSPAEKLFVWHRGSREAPMMMKHNGLYYYLTSLTLWTESTATQYYTAPKPAGPWTTELTPMITPGSTNSWDTQCDFVFPFKGTEDTVYMYCGDRWEKPDPFREGDYAWLPITFSDRDSVIVNYYQDWEVEPDLGLWRPIDEKRNLALRKTATASSENGSNTAGKVTDPSTWENYLNSKWVSASSDPQWITIDLGSSIEVNRVILKWDSSYAKSFKVQVSTDNSTWDDVFSTTKAGARSVTDETFPTTTARYVRMYGTERGNSAGGYSLFDFMVLNDSVPTAAKPSPPRKVSTSNDLSLAFRQGSIYYYVPSGSAVTLDIVDCRGKLITVLVNGFRHAGNHEAVFPGSLVGGAYLVRLTAGEKRVVTMQIKL